ncbi:tripartite tricarboxylate transporter substrate binding protein [Aquabacterium sp. J223]|uniref:Bug family tripartite tricarboxylate transporter substrate binding protein n=1 Tax=Aquabacterium sp. J223 TaxID=2898431 RepID=UPI0021AD88D4|nr:tripartite tricarboxylate transporter substrate binding protein [Aquabacterium sp. J223]UUX94524.1 tripartite tricarboxylate transporter substrate binding protein [Aquabacterium sp. J223]
MTLARRGLLPALLPTLVALPLAVALLAPAAAQPSATAGYPQRPVRLIVGFPAGAGPDILARLLAQKLSEHWGGQGVVVDNKPGAGGLIAASEAARAAPDGHTLLLGLTGNLVIAPATYRKLPYDPLKDFVPVSQVVTSDFVLMSNTEKVPVRDVKEFAAWSQKQPKGIFMGTFGAGTPGHFGAFILGDAVKVKPEVIHYKNTGDVITGLVNGDVHAVLASVGVAAPNVKAGRLSALAVTGPARNPAMPEVPTLKEQGIDLEITSWFGIVVPARTPMELVDRLNADLLKVLQSPDTRQRIEAAGFAPTGTSREAFARLIQSDTAVWGKAVAATGYKAD